MNETLGARALLQRVARGKTTAHDADRLRQWLFPNEQTEIVQAYLLLNCNAEKVKAYIAADLRLNLVASLLGSQHEQTDNLELRRLFMDVIDRYEQYRQHSAYAHDEAREAGAAAIVDELRATIALMKERET